VVDTPHLWLGGRALVMCLKIPWSSIPRRTASLLDDQDATGSITVVVLGDCTAGNNGSSSCAVFTILAQ